MKAALPDPLQVDEFVSSIGLLVRKLHTVSPSGLNELSWTQKSVIVRLDNEGPLTIAALARAESIKPQSMGTVVAELETRGLVERKAHVKDKRQFLIRLTDRGRALRRSGRDERRLWLAELLAKLDRRDLEKVLAAGSIIKRLVET